MTSNWSFILQLNLLRFTENAKFCTLFSYKETFAGNLITLCSAAVDCVQKYIKSSYEALIFIYAKEVFSICVISVVRSAEFMKMRANIFYSMCLLAPNLTSNAVTFW